MKAYREVDHGWNRIMQEVAKLRGNRGGVRVGILGDDQERNVIVGMAQEFGTATIPERSFIRSTIGMMRDKYFGIMGRGWARVLEGKATVYQVLDTLGVVAANDIKTRVTTGEHIPPPLAPETIARKGSSRPLVDTAQMINSVSHEVVGAPK